ncbi:MAG TPA: PIN domain-containing protein [Thermomicrobiales bacterium]|nr:PIN domain-containing protein [Thermomicrobiales bacterium]
MTITSMARRNEDRTQRNERDARHRQAAAYNARLRSFREIWTTEAVLVEVGNALSKTNRDAAVDFIGRCYQTPAIHVVTVNTELLGRAVWFYEAHDDKTWGLTDCISFVVMHDRGLTDALTADHHFRQAGFRPLLLDDA